MFSEQFFSQYIRMEQSMEQLNCHLEKYRIQPEVYGIFDHHTG